MSTEGSQPGQGSGQALAQGSLEQLTREQFDKRLDKTLAGVEDAEYRRSAGWECWDLMVRISKLRARANRTRKQWNPVRLAGAAIPALAAGAGGVLISHLHGTAGTVIGWVALVGGVMGAAISAMRPAAHYAADLRRGSQFEGLYWEVSSYAVTGLVYDEKEQIAEVLQGFSKRMCEISMISANVTESAA